MVEETLRKPWLAGATCAVLHSAHAGATSLAVRAESLIAALGQTVAEVTLANSVSRAPVGITLSHCNDRLHVWHLHRLSWHLHLLNWHLLRWEIDLLSATCVAETGPRSELSIATRACL